MKFSKIKIKKIEKIEEKAFRRASKVKIDKRAFQNIKPLSYRDLIVERERTIGKISTFSNIVRNELNNIICSFPVYEHLSPFYQELMRASLYIKKYKSALKNIAWTNKKIQQLSRDYIKKIKNQKDRNKLREIINEFYGRAASFLKDIRDEGEYLFNIRYILQRFPIIEEDKAIFVVAGAPNVGKSSLINALCEGNVKTNIYPFTTKDLNIGKLDDVIVLIDTPGILEKSWRAMNDIERKAFVAITKLSAVLLYVFDVSLSSGYGFKQQKEIHESIREHFRGEVMYILNKIDIKDKEMYESITNYLKEREMYEVSSETGEGVEELRRVLFYKGIRELSNRIERYGK